MPSEDVHVRIGCALLAAVTFGCVSSIRAEPVTWVVQGTVTLVANYRDRMPGDPPPVCCGPPPVAVDPASIPFAVGDQFRLLFTYESDTPLVTVRFPVPSATSMLPPGIPS